MMEFVCISFTLEISSTVGQWCLIYKLHPKLVWSSRHMSVCSPFWQSLREFVTKSSSIWIVEISTFMIMVMMIFKQIFSKFSKGEHTDICFEEQTGFRCSSCGAVILDRWWVNWRPLRLAFFEIKAELLHLLSYWSNSRKTYVYS